VKRFAGLRELESLDLRGAAKITDAGLKELAGFRQRRKLWLRDTKATKAGLAGLRKSFPACDIYSD